MKSTYKFITPVLSSYIYRLKIILMNNFAVYALVLMSWLMQRCSCARLPPWAPYILKGA